MKILGVDKNRFFIYLISLLLSLFFLSFILWTQGDVETFFVSVGASGLASSLIGFFVDKNTQDNNKKIRNRNLANVVHSYKYNLERFLFYLFKVMIEVYEEKPKENLYKVKIKDIKKQLKSILCKYDDAKHYKTAGTIILNIEENEKHEKALKIANKINLHLKNLSNKINYIMEQDLYGMLNYYSEDEINCLKATAGYFEFEDDFMLGDYYYLFESYIDEDFYKILGIKNLDELEYYIKIEKNKSAIFEKGKLWSNSHRDSGINIEDAVQLEFN